MNLIHQRPQPRPGPAPRASRRAQQLRPSLFNQPSDVSSRKRLAQHMNRGQRVDRIAHGAEPHNQYPLGDFRGSEIGWHAARSHGCCRSSRVRMISVVE
jgi:hypothetical protein